MFVVLVELVLVAGLAVFLGTQVLVPLAEGTPLFPALRRGPDPVAGLEEELRTLNREAVRVSLRDEFEARQRALKERDTRPAQNEGERQ